MPGPLVINEGRTNRVQISAPTGLTLYGPLVMPGAALPDANSWPGAAVVTFAESVPGSGEYFGYITPGQTGMLLLPVFIQAGSQPASTDLQLGSDPNAEACDNRHAFTLALLLDSLSTVISSQRLGAAPGGPRIETLPEPQNSATTAQRILASLYRAREEMACGGSFVSVNIDGQAFTYSSPSAIDSSILFWERKVARLTGRRRRLMAVRLDRF